MRQTYHCFNACLDAVNDGFAWPVAPVSARVEGIKNSIHIFSTFKSSNEIVAVEIVQRITKRHNIDSVALMKGNADFLHDGVEISTGAFAQCVL
ncbi:hypothetical protein ROD_08531 [Citrobacter rodentium ICC168]|uniref:Uncharacterized protein n=1 Tax=Citrobacter rodentium (strain ICC168) TaxID=637910 RepID=D2TQG2_CITRI|nr:hypothetical protein ROD_08531 [Citrobacter rodentium ICC168]